MGGWNIDVPKTEYYGPRPGLSQDAFDHHAVYNLINELKATQLISLDTETTGLVVWKDLPLYWSIAWGNRRATLHASLLPWFREAFEDPTKWWVFANAKYDMHICANVGTFFAGNVIDTRVEHALLYEDKPHDLKFMCKHLKGWTWGDFQTQFGKITKAQSPEALIRKAERENFELLIEYAGNDAWGTLGIHHELRNQLEHAPTHSLFRHQPPYIETLWDLFYKVEVPYTKTLWRMERHGIKVNKPKLVSARPQAESELLKRKMDLVQMRGKPVNIDSTPQLRQWLLEEKQLKPISWTKGGKSGNRNPSVDAKFLQHYADRGVRECEVILEYREYKKLLGTYIIGLDALTDHGHRIHSRFNQDVARCMPASELVLTNRGYIPVEKVKVGDLVISHTGKPRKVTETSKHKPQPIYKVTLSNGMVLHTTGNHQYLSGDSWVRADCLEAEELPHSVSTHTRRAEEWSDIPGWPKYCVSSWGRVKNKQTGNILTPQPKGRWGHLKVTLSRNGTQQQGKDKKDVGVHQLVAKCFLPAQELHTSSSSEVRHLDGIAWNNTVDNLAYGTSAGNTEDARRHGAPKLTNEQVEEIRNADRLGQPVSITVNQSTVWKIEVLDPETTYGLTVEVDHSHVTGGIFTHNTGRLSSADPNLQNIPLPENDHWNLRGSFIPEPGHKLICLDYKQLEMRLLAAASLEQSMIDMIHSGKDIHMGNAELVFGLPYDDVYAAKKKDKCNLTPYDLECLNARAAVKTIGFGILYGMGAPKLANTLGISEADAIAKIEQFMRAYPAVQAFTEEAIRETEQTGYAFTVLGRRRNIPEIASSNRADRSRAERLAVNTQIQGSAADVVKMVQILYDKLGYERDYGCRQILQVHDELVFECPEENCSFMLREIQELMMHPFSRDLAVRLEVDGGIGESWGGAKAA